MQPFPSRTLPIHLDDGLHLDVRAARAFGEDFAGEYCFADPYPHIVIDDFLPPPLIEEIWTNFPQQPLAGDTVFENDYAGLHKRQVFPYDCNAYIRNVFGFFNSAPVLQFLEGLTTIGGLVPDPYFTGGGFHETSRGGKLGIHADFRINEQLHLNRRINLLIYLNKEWRDEYGGQLEIWDRDMKRRVRSVSPVFNRCVIFNTDADSYHGHPDPLTTPDDVTRKSMALYYYTGSHNVYAETPAHSTMYVARPGDTVNTRRQANRLRLQNYIKDWLPPAVFRGVSQLRQRLRSRG